MLRRYNLLPIVILFTAVYSSAAFARSEFTDGYEAAQSGNYKRAVALWTPLAEQGDASAQYTLGWMFESGQGVPQSYSKAVYWYTKAADQGDTAAQYVLGTMYKKGIGVTKDDAIAVSWFTKAANQGDAIAQFYLGIHFQKGLGIEKNYNLSLAWFQKAATQGHITSQINLGHIYQSGKGIKQDYLKAIAWYEKAASQDNALGQYHLAHMYEFGRGVAQNLTKAKSLYLQSANNQYAPASYKVAEFYEQGKGGDIDLSNAVKWYKKSANKGNNSAQFKLGNMYKEGNGTTQNTLHAINWYTQAANQDHPESNYELGVIYEDGIQNTTRKESVKVNYSKAFKFFKQASDLEHPKAHARLAYLYENGLGTEEHLAKATALYQQSTEPWAIKRYNKLSELLKCYETATTKLFSINIACTTRKVLRDKIKIEDIDPIKEDDNDWSDTYFTGAVIKGSSKLKVTYTRDDFFVSAEYTFVGRNNPTLISKLKNKLAKKHGQPDKREGDVQQGPVSFEWSLNDDIHLKISRSWPDTTTYVVYFLPKKQRLLDEQRAQSDDKNFILKEPEEVQEIESDLF